MSTWHRMLVVPAVAALLAACGGGSGPAEAPQLAEDRSASASVAGLIGFARAQIDRATSDTAEPRAIDGITPPISDTDEPQPL